MPSLTAPWDRNSSDQKAPIHPQPLSNEQASSAVQELYTTTFVDKFPRVERLYVDPTYNNQIYCLHSFVPTKNATPDEHGVFGFVKCRGSFNSIQEANQRAEFLIRNVDSYHDLHTTYMGRPFPVCADTKKYIQETHEVDVRKRTIETISESIKQKRLDERNEIEDMKKREEELLKTSKEVQEGSYEEEPVEKYTTLKTKRANLIWTFTSTQEKMKKMRESVFDAEQEIAKMDEEYPELKDQFYQKFVEKRREVGLPEDDDGDNFIKYLVNDQDVDYYTI